MAGGVRLTESVAAVPVDQGHPQRQVPGRRLAEQVDGDERAARPAADERDHGSPATGEVCYVYTDQINL